MKHAAFAAVCIVSIALGCGDSAATGGDAEVNGCTQASADDMTGTASVTLSWSNPHQQCTRVSAGTTVAFTGDFAAHPMSDGSPGSPGSGPLTTDAGAGFSVEFASADVYPYFCTVHLESMQGVIYVE